MTVVLMYTEATPTSWPDQSLSLYESLCNASLQNQTQKSIEAQYLNHPCCSRNFDMLGVGGSIKKMVTDEIWHQILSLTIRLDSANCRSVQLGESILKDNKCVSRMSFKLHGCDDPCQMSKKTTRKVRTVKK